MALRIGTKPKVCKCKVHVKVGDRVIILSGKDKGKKAKSLQLVVKRVKSLLKS